MFGQSPVTVVYLISEPAIADLFGTAVAQCAGRVLEKSDEAGTVVAQFDQIDRALLAARTLPQHRAGAAIFAQRLRPRLTRSQAVNPLPSGAVERCSPQPTRGRSCWAERQRLWLKKGCRRAQSWIRWATTS